MHGERRETKFMDQFITINTLKTLNLCKNEIIIGLANSITLEEMRNLHH